jgi:outer membrane lipoprotein SlyB
MKKVTKIMMATVIVATSATSISVPAEARHHRHHYYGRTYYRHKVCRYSSGTTGLVAGGVAGGVIGHSAIGGLGGTALGAVGGALAGRAVDRASTARRRCYYR